MGELVLQNVDDETVERITDLARRHGRSVEHETLTLLRDALGAQVRPQYEDRAAMARRIAAMTPKGVIQTDSVILIREGSRQVKFVIDTSVAVKWFVPEADHDAAVALLATKAEFVAPDLIFTEFASAMQKKIRLGEMNQSQASESCAALPGLLASVTPTLLLFQRALDIALAISHPVPDCVFLATAEQYGVRMVSADQKLIQKANSHSLRHLIFDLNETADLVDRSMFALALSESDLRDIARLNERLDKTFDELESRYVVNDGRFQFVPSEVRRPAYQSPAYVRLRRTIEAMPPDQMRDLVALCWLGRGYEGTDWPRLRERAETAVGYTPSEIAYVLSCLVDLQAGIDRAMPSTSSSDKPHRDA